MSFSVESSPNRRFSNLRLSDMLFSSAHCYTISRSFCSALASITPAMPLDILVSSANEDKKLETILLSMSLRRIRKRRGPITDPCGTPEITGHGSDRKPLTITCWFLADRNDSIHCRSLPLTPCAESFVRTILWSTLSKAFEKYNMKFEKYVLFVKM